MATWQPLITDILNRGNTAAGGAGTTTGLGQWKLSAITLGFNNYQATAKDSNAKLINLDVDIATGMSQATWPSLTGTVASPDSVHGREVRYQLASAKLNQQLALNGIVGGGSTGGGNIIRIINTRQLVKLFSNKKIGFKIKGKS